MKLIGGLEFSKYDDREMAQQDKGSVIIHFDIGALLVLPQFNIFCDNAV